jgi:hypothetical protein
MPTPFDPTYRIEPVGALPSAYVCLLCEGAGSEHHATDVDLFTLHMQQRHDGRMIDADVPQYPEGG